ncbi:MULTISPECIES: YggT family protein [unclassified Thioalkalivibrio]|uniref:YggT family protein n=1 Tax=unclassified Thioalkalivibrio TaxID=2621013 RepID=UPI0003674DCD|nr:MULTISPECIES: YggT family protein [unclassified Thioalkalivibrio]
MPAAGTGQEIAIFLVSVVFGIYIILLILRTIFGLVRADYYNPISQTIVMLTDPPLRVLRPVIPSVGRVDLAAIVLMIVLKFIEIWLRVLIVGVDVGLGLILAVAIRELLTTVIWVFIIALIVEVVMSWIQAGGGGAANNPIMRLAGAVNRPILGPLRRALPNTGAIDFSPMIALVGLYILLIIVRSF